MKIAVIGIGSPFGDDRIGWEAVERMAAAGFAKRFPTAKFTTSDRPGTNLLNQVKGVGAVVLIDAMEAGMEPGAIVRLEGHEIVEHSESLFSSHNLGVVPALELGRALGTLPDTVILYGVQLAATPTPDDIDTPISEPLNRAADTLIARIEDELQALLMS